jgi:hypothetical protein
MFLIFDHAAKSEQAEDKLCDDTLLCKSNFLAVEAGDEYVSYCFFFMVTGGDKVPTWIFHFLYILTDPKWPWRDLHGDSQRDLHGGKHQGAVKHCSQAAMASSWSPGRRTRQRRVSSRQTFSSRGRQGRCFWETAAFLCFHRFQRHNNIKVEAISAGTHAGAP